MAASIQDIISEYLAKAGPVPDPADLLKGFVAFLKSKGQYIEPGEIKKQFIEVRQVKDLNGVPIEIQKCLVCEHENYVVKGS